MYIYRNEARLTYEAFRYAVNAYPVLGRSVLKLLMPAERHLEVQINRWKKRGRLIPLNRDLFVLNEADRKINPSRLYLACEMYKPSYVSLEYALSFHGLIPETVTDITCVTTRKTRKINNAFGSFIYRHVKTGGFSGVLARKDEAGLPFFMAEPEKALVDFVYLNLKRFASARQGGEMLKESFRLQNSGSLNREKLLGFARMFRTEKLLEIVQGVRK